MRTSMVALFGVVTALLLLAPPTSAQLGPGDELSGSCADPFSSPHIRLDQFGYLPDSTKVAVLREPVANDVHDEVLKQAIRMFYYQRCGVAKEIPHAHPNWTDAPCHQGTEQDLDCRFVLDPSPATSRDLSGGWHDAGDYNK